MERVRQLQAELASEPTTDAPDTPVGGVAPSWILNHHFEHTH